MNILRCITCDCNVDTNSPDYARHVFHDLEPLPTPPAPPTLEERLKDHHRALSHGLLNPGETRVIILDLLEAALNKV